MAKFEITKSRSQQVTQWFLRTLALGTFFLLCAAAFGQTKDEATIRKVLDDQVAAWNNHDLEGFMAGYWKSPELTFFSGGTVTRGWQPTLERYRKRYQSAGAEMGTLEFSGIVVQMLGPSAAFVRGNFHLKMSSGKDSSGVFTLVFRRLPEGWRIVHDHTSV